MLDPTRTLHVDYMHRFTKSWTWKLYGVTTLFEKELDVCGKLQYDAPSYNIQLKTATDNQYFGLSFLRSFAKFWAIGSELFYSHTQKKRRIFCWISIPEPPIAIPFAVDYNLQHHG